MIIRFIRFIILIFAPLLVHAQSSNFYIKIGDAATKTSKLAIAPLKFTGNPQSAKHYLRVQKEISDVFFNDLEVSGLFDLINEKAFLEDTQKTGLKPITEDPKGFKFDSWKQIGAEFLIKFGFDLNGDQLTVECFTYYVSQQKLILGKSYKAKSENSRTVAHTMANDIYKALTGARGPFLTKVAVARNTEGQQKEIFVMDWDGNDAKQISRHRSIALSPAWSQNGKLISYSAYALHTKEKRRNLDLFTYELASGNRTMLSYRNGMNSGAMFMPDGKNLVLTLSHTGNPDIHKLSLDGSTLTRLTNGPRGAINVEPAPNPDGTRIAFSSDRNQKAMIFTMSPDGSNVKQLTFAGEINSTPRWSPDGKSIVFTSYENKHYDLFLIDVEKPERIVKLTSARKSNGQMATNEDPCFSPDGRMIMFVSDRSGKRQLYVVNTDGSREHRITFDQHDYYKPSWSPYLD